MRWMIVVCNTKHCSHAKLRQREKSRKRCPYQEQEQRVHAGSKRCACRNQSNFRPSKSITQLIWLSWNRTFDTDAYFWETRKAKCMSMANTCRKLHKNGAMGSWNRMCITGVCWPKNVNLESMSLKKCHDTVFAYTYSTNKLQCYLNSYDHRNWSQATSKFVTHSQTPLPCHLLGPFRSHDSKSGPISAPGSQLPALYRLPAPGSISAPGSRLYIGSRLPALYRLPAPGRSYIGSLLAA